MIPVAAFGPMPPSTRYVLDDGSILYNDEKIWQCQSCVVDGNATRILPTLTMTPNERLSPDDKKALLSSNLKFSFPGILRMMRSTHIIDAGGVQYQNPQSAIEM